MATAAMPEVSGRASAPNSLRRRMRAALRYAPWLPIAILVCIIFGSILAPWLTPYDPTTIRLSERFMPPFWLPDGSLGHPLGTDALGRDVLSRILFGGRISLVVATFVLVVSGFIGLALGLIAGFAGGAIDAVIMRTVDGLMALPALLVAIVFAISLGPSMQTVIFAIAVVIWSRFTGVIRGEVLAVSRMNYILQARVSGCSDLRILAVHILPNVVNTFVILVTLQIGATILVESGLSFLGAGIPPPTPSWGQMIAEGKDTLASAWWVSFFPGLALALTVLAFNMLGDWARDRFDPKLRQF